MMEFHVSRQSRDRYQFDQSLFSLSGNVVFANFHAARLFAQKMNDRRDLVNFPEQAVRAGQINAMGLIDEILHLVAAAYREQRNPQAIAQALAWLYSNVGKENVDRVLAKFAEEFPPLTVYRREQTLVEYLDGAASDPKGGKVPNQEIVLEELIMLWLANLNPAFSPFLELFDDSPLEKDPEYLNIITGIRAFFETQPKFGPDNQNLIDMLRAPALASPHSLTGQLEFIRERWTTVLGKLLYRLLSSLDLIKEEEKAVFMGPGPSRVYEFRGMELEPERFSPDKDWMPSLLLLAKNAYVWLDQLSKKYHRQIRSLDAVPDEELDTLARWGFTGLWLIGLWERSAASQRIKQMRGNPEAVASAYSLFEYQIAGALGGEEAYNNLRERAWRRGIRLASDMVPNHMGIDSQWVIEHPDWFVSLDYSPFPSYSYNSENLSWDPRVVLQIEDHYFDNTDAAVVFKRYDTWSGDTKFIYHGNDGTSMPWNDTAQLDYLKPEVREAVIQTILHVARKFPIIRFDAAMTLAKKHYQRLWFPEPGTGGAIPSRADHGITKEQFDAAMPEEFWREVVDRVAQEVPDTLLLAEAFWLMEGYFVRTLGMHRVYNSAFMNMLRDEKNAEYRLVMKNTLEFEPEIMKRYVNFMNNPDERTAVDQFGKDDKYFGVAVMMATLPGLPMFGHGQVEGYTEKYGMEYQRAYWDETPDPYLVERHEREIFPLLRKRWVFAEVRDFLLYDFFAPEGYVVEDVFAYSNRSGDERALVIYHNRFATVRGWINRSAAYLVKTGAGGERTLMQRSLAEGLGLDDSGDMYTIYRDNVSGLEYIRSNRELHEKGLYLELEAYKYHVFMGFRQVQDNEWGQYSQLTSYLNGRGVPNIDEAMKEIFLEPVLTPFRELVNPGMLEWLIQNRLNVKGAQPASYSKALKEAEEKSLHLVRELKKQVGGSGDPVEIVEAVCARLEAALHLPALGSLVSLPGEPLLKEVLDYLACSRDDDPVVWGPRLAWTFTADLGKTAAADPLEAREVSRSWIDEWLLGKIIAGALKDLGLDESTAWRSVTRVKLLVRHSRWCLDGEPQPIRAAVVIEKLLQDAEVQQFVGSNRFQGVLWFNKESFEDLLWWLFQAAVIEILAGEQDKPAQAASIARCYELVKRIQAAAAKSDFQLAKLVDNLSTQ